MELKISKVSRENKVDVQETHRETVTFENGVSVHKQGKQYYLSIGGEELPITEEELLQVSAQHDYAFDLIMEKRGKFWFNASIDNVGLNRETI